MLRLAKALSFSGREVTILSTGICLNVGFYKNLWHRSAKLEIQGISVMLLPAIGAPLLGFLFEPAILAVWLFIRALVRKPAALMVYNATLASAVAVSLAWLLSIPVIYEVEDVPDWKTAANTTTAEKPRFFQHLTWLIASKIQMPLSRGVVVPSTRFLRALKLPPGKSDAARVISGCMDVTSESPRLRSYADGHRPLIVLFSGKLEAEHGYDLLLRAIHDMLANPDPSHSVEFHICGMPNRNATTFEPPPEHPAVKYHGFVTDAQYRQLLNDADIGLALQRPSGIFSQTKTPSKAYEFLASGKLVIAMRVGDLDELYPHSAICLENENPAELAALIQNIARNPECYIRVADRGLCTARDRYSYLAAGRTLSELIPANA